MLIGTATLALAAPLSANIAEDRSALADYARARLADLSGESEVAARGYAAALVAAPGEDGIAARAYRQAIAAGDSDLAAQAVRQLANVEDRPLDVSLFFLTEAVRARDWEEAARLVARIEEETVFAAMAPILRAWIAHGSGSGDPLKLLSGQAEGSPTAAYASEHRALLLLALGQEEEGIAAVRAVRQAGGDGALRLRLAAAALLAEEGERGIALGLLDGDERAIVAARAQIERRRPLPGAVDSAAEGIAELLLRLASEIDRSGPQPIAMTLARFATFLAPENGAGWIITGVMLAQAGRNAPALAAVENVREDDPFHGEAEDLRVQLLVDRGEQEGALAAALEHTRGSGVTPDDWTRVGELHTLLDQHQEAADAYARAIELAGEAGTDGEASWAMWLLRGGALVDAGRWDEAKPALERAVELAPNQPIVLNYLGYALLERREDLIRAEDLIRRASELSPENASITDSLGWVYYVQGDLARAIPALERAARGEPAEPTINEHLGDAYWTAGRRREARFAWQAALVSAEDAAEARIRTKLISGLTPATASP